MGLRDIPLRMMSGAIRAAYKDGAQALDQIPLLEPDRFEEVVSSDAPVLIEFFAGWCGPCYVMAPALLEFADERPDVRVVKVDVQRRPSMATDLNVQGLPTLILFRGGDEVLRMTGPQTKQQLLDRVGKALG